MEWLGTAIAVLAAAAAFWQASEARAARRDAAGSEKLAREHVSAAQSSAGSAERAASALEEQTQILRQGQPARPRWHVRPLGPQTVQVRNVMRRRVFDVEVIPTYRSESATFEVNATDLSVVNGQAWFEIRFELVPREADFIKFDVTWREADEPDRQTEPLIINRPTGTRGIIL
ncbi:hypothetical protein GCM10027413_07390 [Conyzicola nivalis]|uniref:Uncharacterized protein n=1 Tax=Conyzicola nivalis TaxID=1477021 RepID=A0A916SK28_9MICO|nr:hypothetical protein [Conyzicola nivalis]GGB04691.1 hypothetical protein GCM10010979_19240 [Conyzicola nivalis]